jgi:hypothetical protein
LEALCQRANTCSNTLTDTLTDTITDTLADPIKPISRYLWTLPSHWKLRHKPELPSLLPQP